MNMCCMPRCCISDLKDMKEWGNQGFFCSGCNWCSRDAFEKSKQTSADNWFWWIRKTLESTARILRKVIDYND